MEAEIKVTLLYKFRKRLAKKNSIKHKFNTLATLAPSLYAISFSFVATNKVSILLRLPYYQNNES